MLDDMKAVKMLGLSTVMVTIVQGLRKREIETSKVYRKLLVWRLLLCMLLNHQLRIYLQLTLLLANTPINLAPVVTFLVYVIISVYWKNESLLTAQAFTSMALITLLTTPVLVFIQTTPTLFQCVGSFDRIQEFCNYTANFDDTDATTAETRHRNGSSISLQPLARAASEPGQEVQKHVIAVEEQNFSWGPTKPVVLKDINFKVEQGTITMLVGPVGSGKSTLLESILGETTSTLGAPKLPSDSIAYCAQQPWLENGTIRTNIIGISPYDRVWYNSVKFACGLDADLQQMEKGDQTMVGSKGLNLSGGQKQRVVSETLFSLWTLLIRLWSHRPSHALSTRAETSFFSMTCLVAWMRTL
jgi:ATP-binding cassette subfamily C (CFTR/MRP) protein 1